MGFIVGAVKVIFLLGFLVLIHEGGERIIQEPTDKDGNAVPIKVTAIDVVPECENATFIKMDIEGAEFCCFMEDCVV